MSGEIVAKKIVLSQGKHALVDEDDFEYLNQWKWYAMNHRNTSYALRTQYLGMVDGKKKQKNIRMHRVIMDVLDESILIDHIDGNGLNNTKKNLRIVSQRQNQQNLHRKITSKYPGVSWAAHASKWRATIWIEGELKHLGYYKSEEKAAQAYEKACNELCGEKLVCKS